MATWTSPGARLSHALGRPGEHERALLTHFEGRCAYDGQAPCLEMPLLLVAFTNRCGSSLYGEMLVQSGAFGGGGEFLNHDAVGDMDRGARGFPNHLADLARASCGPGQAFAVKASWEQLAMLGRWNIAAMFPSVHVIHVYRDDTVAQAVSYSVALQTGRWSSRHRGSQTEPTYRESELLDILATQAQDNARIRAAAAAMGWPRMLVCYEALVADPAHHIRQSRLFCGLDGGDWVPGPTRHRRQADGRNAVLAARLRTALARHVLEDQRLAG